MIAPRTSHYLDFIVPRLQGLMSDYNRHRSDIMTHGLCGDADIEKAITLAEQIAEILRDVAWYIAQGYEPSNPLPIDIMIELTDRQLI